MSRSVHKAGTLLFSVLMVLIGIAIVVRTIAAGGGALAAGLIMGVLFTVAGAGRLWVETRRPG